APDLRAAAQGGTRVKLVTGCSVLAALVLLAGCGTEKSAPSASSSPSINGDVRPGSTLMADPGTWTGASPLTFQYQWRICGRSGASCVDVADATSKSYEVRARDVGHTLRVRVIATNHDGSADATSDPTSPATSVETLYSGAGWTVTLKDGKAQVWRYVGDKWVV